MSTGVKRGLAALVLAPLLYALLGFVVLPWAGLKIANQQLGKYANVPARLERIEFNPFTLELTLHQLRIGDTDAEQLTVERLYADLQIDSLWQGALHLRDVQLEQPYVELLLAPDRPFNLISLFKWPPRDPEAAARPLFPLYIDQLSLAAGSLHLLDERPQPPVELRYDNIALELQQFGTRASDSGQLQLAASGPDGAPLDLQGRLNLQPLRAEGQLKIGEFAPNLWWPYVSPFLPLELELPQGQATLNSNYRLVFDNALQLQLDNSQVRFGPLQLQRAGHHPQLQLERLDLAGGQLYLTLAKGAKPQLRIGNAQASLAALHLERSDKRPLLNLALLEAGEISLDLEARQLSVGKLRGQDLETWAAREADGRLDWQGLIERQLAQLRRHRADRAAQAATGTSASPAAGPASEGAANWLVDLPDIQVRGGHVHFEDRMPTPLVAVEIGPLDLDLQHLSSERTRPFDLRLTSAVAPHGQLAVSGQLHLEPLSGRLQVKSHDLDLRLAQAYLSPFIHLELRSGLLGSDLAVELRGTTPLALTVTGSAEISQLHTLDTLKGRDFVRWHQLELKGLDYRHGQQLRIARVRLRQPYARFIVNEDLTTNIKELLIPQPAKPARQEPPLHLLIGGIDIVDGSANFADFSLTPDFATAIQQLNGQIGTIDNRSGRPSSVDVHGKVDRYAPVSIQGSLTPFSPLQQMDITSHFRRVELTTLTPYAGKFAGYMIRKGRLNLDLHYRITRGQLNAENRILLEGLQLGDRVDSPSATDLPIRLAVALLKDSQGNIDIALPVSGNLNNPEFSVAPIVWQALRNLLLRAVETPFKLLAGLVSGGDGAAETALDSIPFAPGSSTLDSAAQASLGRLAEALQHKPELTLEVEGVSQPALDGPPLAEQRLQREYQYTWYRVLQRRGEQVPAEASQLEVPEDSKAALLEGIYRARLGQQPPEEWRQLSRKERSAQLRQALVDSWASSAGLQRRLAEQRAQEIKRWLVEQGGLADERIFLLGVSSLDNANGGRQVAVPLHLDSL